MSKAYIVTAVDYGETCNGKARTIGVFFDKKEAERTLAADIDYYKAMHPTYKEGKLAVTDDDGNGCEWNLEDVEVNIPLTTLQICGIGLNEIGSEIQSGDSTFEEYKDMLSDEEERYLRDWLKRAHVKVDEEESK